MGTIDNEEYLLGKKLYEELEWLRFFYERADFGPATDDVIEILQDSYEALGREVPKEYKIE